MKSWGLLTRKQRWGFSRWGWLVVISLSVLSFVIGARQVHPFLALTERSSARVLVVEGWLNPPAIREAVQQYRSGGYELVLTTGGPAPGGGNTTEHTTVAADAARALVGQGIPAERIQPVPSRVTERNRTYGSAVALRNWLREQRPDIRSLNVVTEDAHARRTRLLFQKALGDDVEVGIISLPNPDYDARRWWRTSDGVQEVLGELLAYLYVRFLFFPTDADI